MALLVYVVIAFVVALAFSLALGPGFRRQYLLALAGPAALGALLLAALARGCPPNAHECSPELTLFIGGVIGICVTAGWTAGIGIAALVRRLREPNVRSPESQGVR